MQLQDFINQASRTNQTYLTTQKQIQAIIFSTCRFLDSSIAVTCFNHNSQDIHPKVVNKDFPESLRTALQLWYYYLKVIRHLARSNSAKRQLCPDLDRIRLLTSKIHN